MFFSLPDRDMTPRSESKQSLSVNIPHALTLCTYWNLNDSMEEYLAAIWRSPSRLWKQSVRGILHNQSCFTICTIHFHFFAILSFANINRASRSSTSLSVSLFICFLTVSTHQTTTRSRARHRSLPTHQGQRTRLQRGKSKQRYCHIEWTPWTLRRIWSTNSSYLWTMRQSRAIALSDRTTRYNLHRVNLACQPWVTNTFHLLCPC